MTPSEVKHLAGFHARHDTSEKVVMCDWCKKQVPTDQAGLVPVEIDDETGMATDEVNVCYDCLSEHDEPVLERPGWDDFQRNLGKQPPADEPF